MKKQNKQLEQQPSQNGESLSPARRKLLGGMAVTGAAVWHAPVIKSVVTPAHAQTSQSLQTFVLTGGVDIAKHTPSLLDAVIPTANAGFSRNAFELDLSSIEAELVETSVGSGEYNLTLYTMFNESLGQISEQSEGRFLNADGLFMANGLVVGTEGDLINTSDPCMFLERSRLEAFSIQLDSVSDAQAEVTIMVGSEMFAATLIPGQGNLPTPSCQLNAALVYTDIDILLAGEVSIMQTPTDSLLDFIAPAAYAANSNNSNGAGGGFGGFYSIQVTPGAGAMAAVTVVVDGEGTYTGNVSMLSGDAADLSLVPCFAGVNSNSSGLSVVRSLSMSIDSFNDSNMSVIFGGSSRLGFLFREIPAGGGSLPIPSCGLRIIPDTR